MRIFWVLSLLLLSFTTAFARQVSVVEFTAQADRFLHKYVQNGLVDYQAIHQNKQAIGQLYRQIGSISLAEANAAEKKAFYTNTYNLLTIYQIVQHYPVSSPMDIPGFFDKIKHQVAGETFTLNELEKGRLFKQYFDPRLHFVLVCAAESCPQIASYAYQPDKLDQQLEERTRQVLNDPDFIRLIPGKNEVAVSKIFEWYREDFLQEVPSLTAYINRYREKPIPSRYDVSFYEYSWQLNQP